MRTSSLLGAKYFILALLIFPAPFALADLIEPSFIYLPPARTIGKKTWQVEALGSRFVTESTLDDGGEDTALLGDETFVKTEGQLLTRYGLSQEFEFQVGIRYRKNESIIIDPVTGQRFELEEDGMESLVLGATYAFPSKGPWFFSVNTRARRTLFKNPTYRSTHPYDFIVLGDEGTEVGAGGNLSYRWSSRFILSSSLMFNMPNNELSHEFLYDVHGAWIHKRLAFLLGANGIRSARNDSYTEAPRSKPPIGEGNTNLFNSVNREYLSPFVGLNFAFNNRWKLELMARRTIWGRSTDLGTEYLVKLVWRKRSYDPKAQIVDDFKDYALEGYVIKASPRGKFLKIDKGLADDVQKGMKIDIYKTDPLGGNILVASGQVFEVTADTAIVRVSKVFREDIPLVEGLTVRGNL